VTSTFISADQARDSADRSLRGIVELDTDSSWEIESSGVAATLAEYYGAGVTGSALSPPVDPADLRAKLRASAPGLTSLTDRIQSEFDNGACGIFVSRLGLAGLEVDQRRKSVFALAALLGKRDRDRGRSTTASIWDVRPQEEELRKFLPLLRERPRGPVPHGTPPSCRSRSDTSCSTPYSRPNAAAG